jgi:hypothetical protein
MKPNRLLTSFSYNSGLMYLFKKTASIYDTVNSVYLRAVNNGDEFDKMRVVPLN